MADSAASVASAGKLCHFWPHNHRQLAQITIAHLRATQFPSSEVSGVSALRVLAILPQRQLGAQGN